MNPSTKNITRTGVLLALTLAVQLFKLPQLVTGIGVNALLLITLMTVGPIQAVTIGAITPLVALMVGIIKPPMVPAIPFIMASNAVIVLGFHYLRNKNQYLALVVAAFAKFILLFGAVKLVLSSMLPPPILEKVAVAFGITQFFTALAGGIVALSVVPLLKKYLKEEYEVKG